MPLATLEPPPSLAISLAPRRAFHFDPIALASGSVRRILALRDDAFESHAIARSEQLCAVIKIQRQRRGSKLRDPKKELS
jgi:hypothetical protein